MKYSSLFAIIVGLGMIGQWAFSLFFGQVPELISEPFRFGFHLAAELATALLLIGSGIGLLRRQPWAWPVSFFSLGMLLYTVIVSPGYFAQKGEWLWLGLFAVLMCGGLYSFSRIITKNAQDLSRDNN